MPTPDFAAFAYAILDQYWLEAGLLSGTPDGGHIQDIAVKCGLLIPHTATEPCGENCNCADVADFPCTCYRVHEDVLKAKGGADANT